MKYWATEYLASKTAGAGMTALRGLVGGGLGAAGGALAGGALGTLMGGHSVGAGAQGVQDHITQDPNFHFPTGNDASLALPGNMHVDVSHDNLTPLLRANPDLLPGIASLSGASGGGIGGAGAGALMGGLGGFGMGIQSGRDRRDPVYGS